MSSRFLFQRDTSHIPSLTHDMTLLGQLHSLGLLDNSMLVVASNQLSPQRD